MASAFWTLEDGRGFAKHWRAMAHLLALITDELKEMEGAGDFYEYLEKFVYREELEDLPNRYGGFIRKDEMIMFNFDLRSFAPQNRAYFWQAAQNALTKMKMQNQNHDDVTCLLLNTLLDMHQRILTGEDPMLLNNMTIIEPEPTEKVGPGW